MPRQRRILMELRKCGCTQTIPHSMKLPFWCRPRTPAARPLANSAYAVRSSPPFIIELLSTRMNIVLNGEEKSFDAPLTLASLVEQLGMKPVRVAAEVNRAIVPRDRWSATELHDGDRIEIVHFVGGG